VIPGIVASQLGAAAIPVGLLVPALFVEDDVFYTHIFTGGDPLLYPSHYIEEDAFFAPAVFQDQRLLPALFVEADVFFTPFIAPTERLLDGLGATAAWSASRDLLTAFVGGDRYTLDGGGVVSNFQDQSGNNRDLTSSGSQRPALTTAGPNSRACLDFDGAANALQSSVQAVSFISASSGYMVISFIVDAVAGNNAQAFTNDALLGDIGGFFGAYLKNTSPITGQSFNWDAGGEDTAGTNVINAGIPYVIEWRHESGTLYVRVNGAGEQSIASGDTATLANVMNMADGYTGTQNRFNGKIFEAATFSTVPAGGARDNLVADMMAWIGAGASGALTQSATFTAVDNFYTHTVAAPGILTQSAIFIETNTFYAPTVSRGVADVSPALFVEADTFFSPGVTFEGALLVARFVEADAFYAHTLTPATIDLSPNIFTETDAFFSPTVVSVNPITPSLFAENDIFYSPTVAATVLWTPTELGSDLLIWLEASDASNFNLTGALVDQWTGKSPTTINFTGTTTGRPTRETVADFGGLNAVKFDNSDDILVTSSLVTQAQPITICSIYRTGSTIDDLDFHTGDGACQITMRWSGVSDKPHVFCGSAVARTNTVLSTSTTYIDVTLLSGSSSYTRLNGNAADPTTFNPGTSGFALTNVNIGLASGRSCFAGHFAEIVIVKRALTSTEYQKMEGYLAHQWSRTANLPGGHPYKTDPPTV
jgi:hypothetical protein